MLFAVLVRLLAWFVVIVYLSSVDFYVCECGLLVLGLLLFCVLMGIAVAVVWFVVDFAVG